MKALRILFAFSLFLIAVPSFAICGYCDFTCSCVWEPGSGTSCRFTIDCCEERPSTCALSAEVPPSLLASEFRIASVEVTTPATRIVKEQKKRIAVKGPDLDRESPPIR